jgi:GTPase
VFVDELRIHAKAGRGGDGVVRWLRLRAMPKGGPAGGNGGKGGDVLIRAVRDLSILSKYSGAKIFEARNGGPGEGRSKFGRNGEDKVIDLPVGSKVTDLTRGHIYVLTKEGEVKSILKGWQGGLGNETFKSATNRSPQESTKGKLGEEGEFLIELSLLVDVGLIGFPNAGKSTLLNTFTSATSTVGAYPFTTTEPHLGDLFGFVIADIPGLISGAAHGKGLGHKFLKHIAKTKMILHLVSLEEEDPWRAYSVIRDELEAFDATLLHKEEWVVLTKTDLVSDKSFADRIAAKFNEKGVKVFSVSAESGEGIKELRDELVRHLREKVE